MAKQLIVVTDEDSGFEALYVDGALADQNDTIYATDIAEHAKGGPVDFSHVTVVMPDGVDRYPDQFAECCSWVTVQ